MSEYRGGDPGADTLEEWSPVLAVARVRALHGDCSNRCGICHECGARIPCDTMRALEGDEPYNAGGYIPGPGLISVTLAPDECLLRVVDGVWRCVREHSCKDPAQIARNLIEQLRGDDG